MQKMNMQDPFEFPRRGDIPPTRSAILADGTEIKLYIQIKTIEANPISRVNIIGRGWGYPKAGERFTAFFRFESEEYASYAFEQLESGKASLKQYEKMMDQPQYAVCL